MALSPREQDFEAYLTVCLDLVDGALGLKELFVMGYTYARKALLELIFRLVSSEEGKAGTFMGELCIYREDITICRNMNVSEHDQFEIIATCSKIERKERWWTYS